MCWAGIRDITVWQTLYDYHDLILGEYICIAKVASILKVDMGLPSFFFYIWIDVVFIGHFPAWRYCFGCVGHQSIE